MATRHDKGALAPTFPLDVLLSSLPSLPRPVLDQLTCKLIEHLDTLDGDPDAELNGDEADGSLAEDDFHGRSANWLGHPGCPISDPGGDPLDEREDDGIGPDMRPIVDREAYREQVAKARQERSYKLPRVRVGSRGYEGRALYVEPAASKRRRLLRRKRGMPRYPRA